MTCATSRTSSAMTDAPPTLVEQAQGFADELTELLTAVLPGAPGAVAERVADRIVVRPEDDVPIMVDGARLASLEVH